MRLHVTFLLISLVHLSLGIETKYERHLDEEFLTPDTNFSITPRKGGFKFEDDQTPDDDLSNVSLDEPGPFRFQDDQEPGRVTFQDNNGLNEPENYGLNQGYEQPSPGTFQEGSGINQGIKKKRRRRRRKPRYQGPGQYVPGTVGPVSPGYNPGFPGPNPGFPGPLPPYQYNPGPQGPSGQYPGPFLPSPHYPGGQYYRPPRRPKQSFASEALSKVIGALTSIALYDDYQCVPRLLCEAAGGGALGTSPVLQSIAGLQPLLTLLSAYSGISSSPLFIFGRAVFLGMTAKGNTASCRYGYPQCPTDPEQLVHYLNNHNGGFFRFFNTPQPHPQNLEQFYNQLSGQYQYQNFDPSNQPSQGQHYGPYPQPGPQNPNQQAGSNQPTQNYLYDPVNQLNQYGLHQNYGFHNPQLLPNPQNPVQQFSPYQPYPQNYDPVDPNYGLKPHPENSQGNQYGLYGLNNQFTGHRNPNFYSNKLNSNTQNYGSNYPYVGKYGFQNVRFKDNGKSVNIEKRIQNKPTYLYVDSDVGNVDINTKWIFPENYGNIDVDSNSNIRGDKHLKFPDDSVTINNENDKRKGKSILFPEPHKYINYYEYSVANNENFKFNHPNYYVVSGAVDNGHNNINYNDAVNNNKRGQIYNQNKEYNGNKYSKYMYNIDEEEGIQTVYIVRGNGDPNNPEIVKIRPGERVMI